MRHLELNRCIKLNSFFLLPTERKEEIADLAERLLAADRRELDLKEKLHNLQKAEKEMELALQEQKRVNDDLRQELKDQDDLIGKVHNQYWAKMWNFLTDAKF